jgi:comEA protein
MDINSIILKMQEKFHVTRSELFAVSIILTGLLVGAAIKLTSSDLEKETNTSKEIFSKLHKLAEEQRTTYIGTDTKGNSFPELANADTVVKKETYYPSSPEADEIIGRININTASRVELMKLPGIGEKTADKIINFRKVNPFSKIEDIMKVKGIGTKKFEKMKDKITVD